MKTLHVHKALKTGWDKFMERSGYLFAITLGFALIIVVTGSGNALFTALSLFAYGGYLSLMLRHFRGEKISFDRIFDLDMRWLSFAFVVIVKGLVVMLGLVCFIFPGIYLALRYAFAEILVIDEGLRPMEAMKKSAEMTLGVKWKLVWFGFLSSLIMFLGLLVLVVGSVVSGIIISFAFIALYSELKDQLA